MTGRSGSSGVLTFLFTVIEGSTRRWDTDAHGMRAALAAHDVLLRDTVAAHNGWLFKHTGDGVCAVFASPQSAVDAAAAAAGAGIAGAHGHHDRRGGTARRWLIRRVLNRPARLMAAGHGGQILLGGAAAGRQ